MILLKGLAWKVCFNIDTFGIKELVPAAETVQVLQKFNTSTLFINGYINFPTKTLFNLYLLAGAGISRNNCGQAQLSSEDIQAANGSIKGSTRNKFVWNVGCGVVAKITTKIYIDLSYRYVDLGAFKDSEIVAPPINFNQVGQRLRAKEALLGLSYFL